MRKRFLIILSFLCVVSSASFVFSDETELKTEIEQTINVRQDGPNVFQARGGDTPKEPPKSPNVFQARAGEKEAKGDSGSQSKNSRSSKNVFLARGDNETQITGVS